MFWWNCRVCPPAKPVEPLQCQGRMAIDVKSEDYCGFALSTPENPFLQCILHSGVDFTMLTRVCEYDVCENHLNISAEMFFGGRENCLATGECSIDFKAAKDTACGVIQVVVAECEGVNFPIARWRTYFDCGKL